MKTYKNKDGRITKIVIKHNLPVNSRHEFRLPNGHYGKFKAFPQSDGTTILLRVGTRKDLDTLMKSIVG